MDDFTEKRIPFIVFGDKDIWFNHTPKGTCKEWALSSFPITEEDFEKCIRGYIMEDRVQFFRGSNYEACQINGRVLDMVAQEYKATYGKYPAEYHSGVVVGEVGEVWPPINTYNLREYYPQG